MPKPTKLKPPKPHEREWGSGSVKEIRPGVWRAWRARTSNKITGKPQRASQTFYDPGAAERARVWARGAVEPAVLLLGQWLDRWLDLTTPTIEPSTARTYEAACDACLPLHARPLADLTTEEWQTLTNDLLKGWSRYHVAVWRRIITIAMRAAMPEHLAVNPLARVKLPKPDEQEPKAWRQDEVDRLLAAAAGHQHEPWLVFVLGTGVRIGESRALLRDDLDLRSKTATIRASLDSNTNRRGPTKSKRVRVVDLPDEAIPLLTALGMRRAPGQEHVFGHGGKPYAATTYRQWLRRLCDTAQVRRLPPHSLRHTAASLALDDGVPVQDVARQLGHSVSVCLKTYSHWLGDGQRRVAKALGKSIRSRLKGPSRANTLHASSV